MKNLNVSMPLYYQIVSDIKAKIEEGILAPGDKLPTENTLSKTYQVSRVTVRNALNALVETKLVERQPNRGYFVAKLRESVTSHKGFSLYDDLVAAGYTPGSKILSMTTESCGSRLASIFGCDPEDLVIVIHRIRLADQVPFAEEVNYLPSWIFEGINPWEMEAKSLIEIMETQFGVKIAYSMQTLKAKVPTKEQKEILNLTSNAPHLSIRSKVYDKSGKVVKYTKVFFRTDIVEYSFVWTV